MYTFQPMATHPLLGKLLLRFLSSGISFAFSNIHLNGVTLYSLTNASFLHLK